MVEFDRTGKIPRMSKSSGSEFNDTTVRYLRPFNYNIPVGIFATAGAVCLSPNRQPTPCKEFLVQADLANPSFVSIGFQGTNLVNGLQFLAGQGWIFSIAGMGDYSRIIATPTNWVQGLAQAQDELYGVDRPEQELRLDIADFWVAGGGALAQNLIIFYLLVPGVKS
jgi:hypothetical protein